MPRILITGANGQVGQAFRANKYNENNTLFFTDKEQLNITDTAAITHAMSEHQPNLIINLAAYTQVDQAESYPEAADQINHIGAKNLAVACQNAGIPLLHLSTDYVFDGNANTPYSETDAPCPTSVYGQTKLAGEAAIAKHCPQHVIIRTSWVFSQYAQNFVKSMLKLGQERAELNIVSDQVGGPTSADAIVAMLVSIAEQVLHGNPAWGLYHFSGQPSVSWHQFASTIFTLAEPLCTLALKHCNPIPSSQYPTPAKRPHYSVLNTRKIQQQFGILPCQWQQDCQHVIETLLKEH